MPLNVGGSCRCYLEPAHGFSELWFQPIPRKWRLNLDYHLMLLKEKLKKWKKPPTPFQVFSSTPSVKIPIIRQAFHMCSSSEHRRFGIKQLRWLRSLQSSDYNYSYHMLPPRPLAQNVPDVSTSTQSYRQFYATSWVSLSVLKSWRM